jgi:hypothetical protein
MYNLLKRQSAGTYLYGGMAVIASMLLLPSAAMAVQTPNNPTTSMAGSCLYMMVSVSKDSNGCHTVYKKYPNDLNNLTYVVMYTPQTTSTCKSAGSNAAYMDAYENLTSAQKEADLSKSQNCSFYAEPSFLGGNQKVIGYATSCLTGPTYCQY